MTELHRAAQAGDLSAMRAALAQGASLDALDEYNRSAIVCALYGDQPEALALLLDAGAAPDADPREEFPWQWGAIPAGYPRAPQTLLHKAAQRGGAAVVPVLLARGVPLEARDSQGCTALTYAARHGRAAAVRALLEAGADPNARDAVGYTPVHYVNGVAAAEVLLAAGADPDGGPGAAPESALGEYYRQPLLVRATPELVAVLLRAGAHPARHPGAVAWHAHYGNAGAVAALLDAGADPDDEVGRSPALASAAAFARREIVERLLAAGARARDAALYTACGRSLSWGGANLDERREERVAIVARLLAAGADPGVAFGALGERALHVAASNGLHEVVEMLLAAKADLEATDGAGRTPLALAAEGGHTEVVHRLLAAGANARCVDAAGRTPVEIARKSRAADHRLVLALRDAAGDRDAPPPPEPATTPPGPAPGGVARHAKFGEGRVVSVSGAGGEAKVTVRFASGETRTLMARFLQFA